MNRLIFSEDFLKKLDKLCLISRQLPESYRQGTQKTYRKGTSLEFSDYRTYNPGDDIRGIDWNVWSRSGKFFIKLYAGESDRKVTIIVDTSASMGTGTPGKLVLAVQAAASLGYISIKNHERVEIISVSENRAEYMRHQGKSGNVISLLDFLSSLEASGRTNLEESLKTAAEITGRGGIVIVISDLLDSSGFSTGLKHLLYNRNDVILLHILGEKDFSPGLEGPVRIKDAESGAVSEITVDRRTASAYKKRLKNFLGDVEKFCIENRIEYIRFPDTTPFEDLVLKYMRQGVYLK